MGHNGPANINGNGFMPSNREYDELSANINAIYSIIGTIHVFHALTLAVARGICLDPRLPGRGFKLIPRDTANINAVK